MKKVFFAGSFNPFTKGHADIVERLLVISEKVCIGIGINIEKPGTTEAAEINAREIREWVKRSGYSNRVEVIVYNGLTGEEAIRREADCMARGVRNATDFDYEYSLAAANKEVFGIETILIPSSPKLSFISSTLVRDLESHGKENIAKKYLP